MSTKNLKHREAIEKIKSLAESIDFAMLCTDLAAKPFHAIPMSTKQVDEEGAIWFLSGADSKHNANIKRDASVELLYSHPGSMSFLSIFGEATLYWDKELLKSLYESTDDAWFEGVDDPNLTAIKVRPIYANYWDPKSNKLVSMLKMGVSALTGQEPDLMDQGKLKLDSRTSG
jgi:general stress protein 26